MWYPIAIGKFGFIRAVDDARDREKRTKANNKHKEDIMNYKNKDNCQRFKKIDKKGYCKISINSNPVLWSILDDSECNKNCSNFEEQCIKQENIINVPRDIIKKTAYIKIFFSRHIIKFIDKDLKTIYIKEDCIGIEEIIVLKSINND